MKTRCFSQGIFGHEVFGESVWEGETMDRTVHDIKAPVRLPFWWAARCPCDSYELWHRRGGCSQSQPVSWPNRNAGHPSSSHELAKCWSSSPKMNRSTMTSQLNKQQLRKFCTSPHVHVGFSSSFMHHEGILFWFVTSAFGHRVALVAEQLNLRVVCEL